MCTRRRQQAAVEHKGIPRHNGHDSTIAVRLRLSAKVALSDAAEILAGAIVIEVLDEERLPRLALERHGLAVHHVEPLTGQFDICSGTSRRGRAVENSLARLGSDREHDSIALVGARVLRLGDHLRSVRLRELERDLLRNGDATQRDLVRSALIVRDVEVDDLVRTVLRDRRPFEVATLVGRRRERRVAAGINSYRSVVDRAVDRPCRHLKALGLIRVIGFGIVRIRIVRIRLIRVGLGVWVRFTGIRIIRVGVRLRIVGVRIIRVGVVGVGIRIRPIRVRVVRIRVIRIVRIRNDRVGINGLLFLFHRQRSGHDLDIEVRVSDRRANLVLASRRALIGIAGVLDLHARGIYRTLQGRGERRVRLPLEALGVVDLHLELRRSDFELADGGTGIAMGS